VVNVHELLVGLREKHGVNFELIEDAAKSNLHLWIVGAKGIKAHVWTFTPRRSEDGLIAPVKEAERVILNHLRNRDVDRLTEAIISAKKRLKNRGLLE